MRIYLKYGERKRILDDEKLKECITSRINYKEWLKEVLKTERMMTEEGLELRKAEQGNNTNRNKYNKQLFSS